MSKPVHRLGDPADDGGTVNSIPQSTVYVNDKLVSVDGSVVSDLASTDNGSSTVFVAGLRVNRQGDSDTDGSTRDSGSPNVFIGP